MTTLSALQDHASKICHIKRNTSTPGCMDATVQLSRLKSQLLDTLELNASLQSTVCGLEKKINQVENNVRSHLISRAWHEFRTPLNHIMGSLQLLWDNVSEQGCRDLIRTMLTACKTLNSLTEDLITTGSNPSTLSLHLQPIDLQTWCQGVLKLFKHRANKYGVDLKVQLSNNLPSQVLVDTARLSQVVHNLLMNAIKFSAHTNGEVILSVDPVGHRGGDKQAIKFQIQDNGIGLKQEDNNRVFEPFFQVYSNNESSAGSLGLGLTVAKTLVEFMGGEINLSSTFEVGTTVSFVIPVSVLSEPGTADLNSIVFTSPLPPVVERGSSICPRSKNLVTPLESLASLSTVEAQHKRAYQLSSKLIQRIKEARTSQPTAPLTPTDPPQESKPKPPNSPKSGQVHRSKVPPTVSQSSVAKAPCFLVVDDNILNVKLLEKMLGAVFWCNIDVCFSGEVAVQKASTSHWSLILMDIHMPGMNGIDASRSIVQNDPNAVVVAVTTDDSEQTLSDCIKAGMLGHISKPLNKSVLANRLCTLQPKLNPFVKPSKDHT